MSSIERNFAFLASVARSKASHRVLGFACYALLQELTGKESGRHFLLHSHTPTLDLIEEHQTVLGTVTYSLEVWKIT
jgi:hypothetical protein